MHTDRPDNVLGARGLSGYNVLAVNLYSLGTYVNDFYMSLPKIHCQVHTNILKFQARFLIHGTTKASLILLPLHGLVCWHWQGPLHLTSAPAVSDNFRSVAPEDLVEAYWICGYVVPGSQLWISARFSSINLGWNPIYYPLFYRIICRYTKYTIWSKTISSAWANTDLIKEVLVVIMLVLAVQAIRHKHKVRSKRRTIKRFK